jgi:hypothetical protein
MIAVSGCPAFESQGSSEVPSARPRPELAFEVEGRGTILTLADDFIWPASTAPPTTW